ncbi:MAG: DsbA family oxidoreductase [Carnobacterium sp.]|uniref:DsbA family protein n=1 Tax=Carnobacterium antarcticum TaxID=2126436 RepID=A0ABW4NLB7_9LACT|nr:MULTISPECIES: DsbA family oxidoreductase [unclassified Carnobacterium]ALV21734.1 2-hydroxychromene-2-carboxylate isomerase/DsbA-like thioredoxin domain [Carnobacterium sp. CP1]QQP69741.1 DsbA family oxidoreductase [Carnobacterium sp. CS13]
MKIDIWTDFVCPFCYIGKRHLEEALGDRQDVEIEYHSYELDPTAPEKYEGSIEEYFKEKKGMEESQAQEMIKQVTQMAHETGLDYHYETIQHGNSLKAHRLFQYAKEQGKGNEFIELGKKAYFIESQSLNDTDVLVRLAVSLGLAEDKVREILSSEEFLSAVRIDQAEAAEIGVQGVPFFVINEKYGISGAQPVATFKEVIADIEKEES